MTIEKLLAKLRKDRADLDAVISTLAKFTETDSTAARIVASIKAPAKRKLHWTQRPENAARLRRIRRRSAATQKANRQGAL